MVIRTIFVIVEDEKNKNAFYWGSEYGYNQIIDESK